MNPNPNSLMNGPPISNPSSLPLPSSSSSSTASLSSSLSGFSDSDLLNQFNYLPLLQSIFSKMANSSESDYKPVLADVTFIFISFHINLFGFCWFCFCFVLFFLFLILILCFFFSLLFFFLFLFSLMS